MLIASLIFTGIFIIAMWFFTSSSEISKAAGPAYPFVILLLGLAFLYMFVSTLSGWSKWLCGIMFLVSGYACTHNVEKIRRRGRHSSEDETNQE